MKSFWKILQCEQLQWYASSYCPVLYGIAWYGPKLHWYYGGDPEWLARHILFSTGSYISNQKLERTLGMVNLTDSGPFSTIMPSVNIAYHIIPRTTTSHIGAVFVWSVIVRLVGSPVGEDDTFPGELFPVAFWILVSDTWPGQDQGPESRIKVLDPWFKD